MRHKSQIVTLPLDTHWNVGRTMYNHSYPKFIIAVTFHVEGTSAYISYSKAKKYVKKINIKNFIEYRK
jgi:hypothetical protein